MKRLALAAALATAMLISPAKADETSAQCKVAAMQSLADWRVDHGKFNVFERGPDCRVVFMDVVEQDPSKRRLILIEGYSGKPMAAFYGPSGADWQDTDPGLCIAFNRAGEVMIKSHCTFAGWKALADGM